MFDNDDDMASDTASDAFDDMIDNDDMSIENKLLDDELTNDDADKAPLAKRGRSRSPVKKSNISADAIPIDANHDHLDVRDPREKDVKHDKGDNGDNRQEKLHSLNTRQRSDATATTAIIDIVARGAQQASSDDNCVSSRYDTCIVYALDECLTRGAYHIFAKWFHGYLSKENLPGSMVVVGFSKTFSNIAGAGRGDGCTSSINGEPSGKFSRGVNLGGAFPVPYIRLDPNDAYAIFDFKRQTGYPAIVLLVTLPASRMEMCLSCDGAILVLARHAMRRNMTEVAEVLQQLNRSYLADLYASVNSIDDGEQQSADSTIRCDEDEVSNCNNQCRVSFERRRDNDGTLIAMSHRPIACSADRQSSSSPSSSSSSSLGWPLEKSIERSDDAIVANSAINVDSLVTSFQLREFSSGRELFFQPPIERDNEHDDDDDDTMISIPSDNPCVIASTAMEAKIATTSSREGDSNDNKQTHGAQHGAMSMRLRGQNKHIIQQLQHMDRALTETHSTEYVPVVHGDSVDIVIPTSVFYEER